MKFNQKFMLGIIASTLAFSAAIILVNQNSTTVAAATSSNKLKLAHGAYVYSKSGKRMRTYRGSMWKTHFKKGATVKFTGSIKPIERNSKHFFLLDDDNYHQSWLPYRKVGGNCYYNIGNGGYIKAGNVKQIAGKPLYISEATVKISNMGPTEKSVFTGTGDSKVILKDGKTYKVDYIYSDYGGNSLQNYYHIVNIDGGGFATRLVKDKPRQRLATRTSYTYVGFIRKINAYTITSILNHKSSDNVKSFNKNINVPIIEAIYLWVAQDRKAELFYRLMDVSTMSPNDTPLNQPAYIKADDTKYISGPLLTPINTVYGAEEDSKVANKSDRKVLQSLINQENVIKDTDNYKNDNYEGFASTYNYYLKKAKAINSSQAASIIEVKQAAWLLSRAQQRLLEANEEKAISTAQPAMY